MKFNNDFCKVELRHTKLLPCIRINKMVGFNDLTNQMSNKSTLPCGFMEPFFSLG